MKTNTFKEINGNHKFEITFLGVGGSCSVSRPERVRYGTNTPSVVARAANDIFIFDGGSGLANLEKIFEANRSPKVFHIFLSHYHTDHISGLAFSPLLLERGITIHFYGHSWQGKSIKQILSEHIGPPYLPIGLDDFPADIHFHDIKEGDSFSFAESTAAINATALAHPNGSMGYRLDFEGKSFCYLSDVELAACENLQTLQDFTKNTDLLLVDAFYDDGLCMPGWGHSSWKEAADFALASGVKSLGLFHYDFHLTDTQIDHFILSAQKIYPNTFGATELSTVIL